MASVRISSNRLLPARESSPEPNSAISASRNSWPRAVSRPNMSATASIGITAA